jgi:hypothetical protein
LSPLARDTGHPSIRVVECPTCRGFGRRLRGFDNRGAPILSGDCARCGRSGFVPVLDGEPSYPFGKDKDHPVLLALEPQVHKQEELL